MKITLKETKVGQVVSVLNDPENSKNMISLLSFGVLPGDKLEIISMAPFNGPITCRHQSNTLFALRLDEASKIHVSPL